MPQLPMKTHFSLRLGLEPHNTSKMYLFSARRHP
jgi:hypothetical protein